MPEFTYEAMQSTGLRTQGTLTAGTEREALAILDSRGMFPLKVVPVRRAGVSWLRRGVRARHLATFYAQLADLLHSGVPLLKSLDLLERQNVSASLSETLREVRAKVADGTGLAQAMSQHPHVFDDLAVGMIRAGQEGGFLEDVLKRIAEFTERAEDLKAKVTGALAYPVFLAAVGFIVLNVLVIFFIPSFEQVFKSLEAKGQLPWITKALIGFSHFVQGYWWLILLTAAGAYAAFYFWSRSPGGRMILDAVKLRVPGAGPIYRNLAIARFTRILGTQLHNGIPILQALRIAKDATGNKVLALAIEQSAENIKGGEKLATPLAASKYFPRDVVEIIAVGEESNNLEKVLMDVADSLEKRTGRQLDLFVRLLEPLMLLVMAAVTLVVVVGLLLPVFKMSSAVG